MVSHLQSILDSTVRPGDALADLRSHLDLGDIYREAAGNSALLAQITSAGQKHDNGFDKIVLSASAQTGLKLVLHCWNLDELDGEDNIHNHRWNFASVILRGMLCSEIYSLRPQVPDEIYSAFSYSSPAGTEQYGFREAGTVSASLQAVLKFSTASTYVWGHEIHHRAYGVGSPSAATIIVQSPPVQPSTLVLLRGTRPAVEQQPVRHLTNLQVTQALEVLREPDARAAWKYSQ